MGTGEITTLGEVISIGGVREKLTACKNHQISTVVLPLSNKKNVSKLPDEFKKGFKIFYVTNTDQPFNICFNTNETQTNFEELERLGVVMEDYGTDTYMNDVLNHE